MRFEDLKEHIQEMQAFSLKVLAEKSKRRYNRGSRDALANFHKMAVLQSAPATAVAYSLVAKHLVQLASMCQEPDTWKSEEWREVLADIMNYMGMIYALQVKME